VSTAALAWDYHVRDAAAIAPSARQVSSPVGGGAMISMAVTINTGDLLA
jgi:hypothetical protein